MPGVTVQHVRGWAHCPDPRCTGNRPVEVDVDRQITEFTYIDNGGDLPGTERSVEHLRFADEATDANCPGTSQGEPCSRVRELSLMPRPQYAELSGYAQDGLLRVKSFDPTVGPAPASNNDAVVAQLMRQVQDLSDKLAAQPEPKPETAKVKPTRTAEEQARIDERMAKVRAARNRDS